MSWRSPRIRSALRMNRAGHPRSPPNALVRMSCTHGPPELGVVLLSLPPVPHKHHERARHTRRKQPGRCPYARFTAVSSWSHDQPGEMEFKNEMLEHPGGPWTTMLGTVDKEGERRGVEIAEIKRGRYRRMCRARGIHICFARALCTVAN